MPKVVSLSVLTSFCYLILFSIFFILHGNNQNFGLISLAIIGVLFIKYFLISVFTFLISWGILRDSGKTLILSFGLMVIYFFFGYIQDIGKSLLGNIFFTSYTFLLPLLFVAAISIFFLLKRAQHFKRLLSYIKFLIIILVVMELLFMGVYCVNGVAKTNNLNKNNPRINFTATTPASKPDIFFIVFDEYASSESLRNDLNFNNDSLDAALTANHFFISTTSKSNYNLTPFSLASTLGMDYLNIDSNNFVISQKTLLQAVQTVKESYLIKFFKKQDYQIKNLSCFDFEGASAETFPYFGDFYFSGALDNQTLSHRVRRDIWWNFLIKDIFTGKFRVPQLHKEVKREYIYRNVFNYEHLLKELGTNETSPKFVYTHLMLPHEPFYVKADGSFVSDTNILLNTINTREGYLNQLTYANTLIKRIIAESVKKTGRNRVVIIEGDHGYRSFPDSVSREHVFKNLNCYYFSDENYASLYPGISPVNSFRVILNKYFAQSLKMLKDSSTYLIDPEFEKK